MKIVARQEDVARLEASLQQKGVSADGWTSLFTDVTTGEVWTRFLLGSEYHGGGTPILIKGAMPSTSELLDLATKSSDEAELVASVRLLFENDREGGYKEALLAVAEQAAGKGDRVRAEILVRQGMLADESNLRPALGKHWDEVTADHNHFKTIAQRARALVGMPEHIPPDDPSLFRLESPPDPFSPVLKDSARRVVRLALGCSALGLTASILAHILAFSTYYPDFPGWFIPVPLGIFPLGIVGIYVGYWIGVYHGTWGSGDQWAWLDARLPAGVAAARTAMFFYALLWFLWVGVTDSLEGSNGFPLEMVSAFTASLYFALLTIFKAALTRSPRRR